ncbi:MAG: calcium/sodium antiporter [Melioribacteraceae bacterium]|nr:calcium/sodium antiporter [Melioribacteraceae bacterium]
MVEIILYLAGGLLIMLLGAEGLVRGASALALRIGISPLVVGLTVVAFGTSSPELVVSIGSAIEGNSDIAIGNVIGSNISNIALILGITALINPIKVNVQLIKREIPIMIGVTIVFLLFFYDLSLSRFEGFLLFIGIIVYTVISYKLSKKEKKETELEFEKEIPRAKGNLFKSILMVVFGLIFLAIGSKLFVDGAIEVALMLNISQVIIGLTIVAVGTSLPELITSVVASIKKEGDIAIGNVVGSNIFNLLSILGLTAIIYPITSESISMLDLGMFSLTALTMLPLSRTGFILNRIEGAILIGIYVTYIYFLIP